MTTTIDEALDILHSTGPDLVGGNSNHGPMVAEALCVLDRTEAVLPWLAKYTQRCQDRPLAQSPIAPTAWQASLGDRSRSADWVAFFKRELAEAPWQGVLRIWGPRLVPGLWAAATHGLLRTGHAVRSLTAGTTPQRLHELAEGLGYWASRYQTLPGTPSGQHHDYAPRQAVQHVRRVHGPDFEAQGSIVQQITGLRAEPDFAQVVDLVDTTADLSQFISNLTETFAGIYLANPRGLPVNMFREVSL